ncbi:ABC transporter substrate-binding protein [Rhizobium lusitanum]|uniref:Branched-chain amino acid transport system substrate-binding protein n=1 Tax=Rhizobium lusitanum TaxID=293958 RepID=A0A7X0J0Z0_9HYPH|nr:ABC transporter substrate-binding protein [Rhizobium lusitanum]MBB6489376.1 branched-chain amino acid transport system substrate-binding protein [Rhizobium lusitanum]
MKTKFGRRKFLAASALALAAPALLSRRAFAADAPIKVGFVTSQTGPLAFFGEPDSFILGRFQAAMKAGASGRPIEIIVKDSQSNPSRASELASQLALKDEVQLLITAGGPDTVIPVADQAEIKGVPMIGAACPWQPFVFGRNSTPDKGFDWNYLFAFGLEDAIAAYMGLWATIQTNRKVGLLFANDADGNAWGDAKFGFPPALTKAGYTVVDTGRYTPLAEDFTAQITKMKSEGVDIVAATMIPPEFFAFWSQAKQQGFHPKVATIGKSLLLPTTLDAIGPAGNGLSTEVAWHPSYSSKSVTTGDSSQVVADEWQKATGKQWTQPVGLKHALVDIAVDVLKRASDPTNPSSVVEAIKSTKADTLLGTVDWNTSPIKNVAKVPIVGGQWRQKDGKFDLVVCANPTTATIPVADKLKPLA